MEHKSDVLIMGAVDAFGEIARGFRHTDRRFTHKIILSDSKAIVKPNPNPALILRVFFPAQFGIIVPVMKLREGLNYEPAPLRFGTSGRRGLIADLTQLEVCINALAELEYLQSLPRSGGGVGRGEEFFYACDLRPSSSAFVPSEPVRGELAQAIGQAVTDAGMKPVFLGFIPTPALASYALNRSRGSMMVTGSHIPFDRNGYKTNSALGELLKRDEAPIQARVEQARARLYGQPMEASQFNSSGMFRDGSRPLPACVPEASGEYLRRYTDYFAGQNLRGMRLLVSPTLGGGAGFAGGSPAPVRGRGDPGRTQ